LLLGRKNTLSSEVEFEIPTWEQIYESLLNLADRVRKANFKPDVIVGVSRGGWPPARIMSDLLENPELANVKAEFYLGVAKTKGEPMITQPVSTSVTGKKVLVVDEVADTGKSLHLVQSHLKERGATEVKILTIYYKPWSVVIPDWYGKKTSRWIIFPWEQKENVRQILKEYKTRGEPIEEAVNKLVLSGLNRKLLERFIKEISEGQS
jgi:hypoxanthine phosphoribosyltransferase